MEINNFNLKMKTLEEIKQEYPLHWHVWQNNVEELKEILKNDKVSEFGRGCRRYSISCSKICQSIEGVKWSNE